MGADLSANTALQSLNIRRTCWPFRGQVRSHEVSCATALCQGIKMPLHPAKPSRQQIINFLR
ncbi:hypothetical protein EZZ81_09865 [Pseudomonas viridiflava]|uniref:Uncharacterized protein n=1 Tax=Pseudomonas viridiflava TaxID=33069 RepID=A0AA46VV08_PSEVI|nr:hypothetical protein EZZ81_09865 [Pseudomonas viridiflava]